MSLIKHPPGPVDAASVRTVSQLADRDEVQDTVAARAASARRVPATMMRPKPQRVPELAHMDLKRLRRYRRTLLDEELRASYWRRLIQARRDLLRAHDALGDRQALTEALTEQRSGGEQGSKPNDHFFWALVGAMEAPPFCFL